MNRAWTFVISKPLNTEQLASLKSAGKEFVAGWTAHDVQLTGSFDVYKDRIVVVTVNEDAQAASGCSIDKLTRFIKETEQQLQIQLMNRLLVAYNDSEGNIHVNSASEIKEKLSKGEITSETTVYNTSVANQEELKNWIQPLKATWLNKFLTKV